MFVSVTFSMFNLLTLGNHQLMWTSLQKVFCHELKPFTLSHADMMAPEEKSTGFLQFILKGGWRSECFITVPPTGRQKLMKPEEKMHHLGIMNVDMFQSEQRPVKLTWLTNEWCQGGTMKEFGPWLIWWHLKSQVAIKQALILISGNNQTLHHSASEQDLIPSEQWEELVGFFCVKH